MLHRFLLQEKTMEDQAEELLILVVVELEPLIKDMLEALLRILVVIPTEAEAEAEQVLLVKVIQDLQYHPKEAIMVV